MMIYIYTIIAVLLGVLFFVLAKKTEKSANTSENYVVLPPDRLTGTVKLVWGLGIFVFSWYALRYSMGTEVKDWHFIYGLSFEALGVVLNAYYSRCFFKVVGTGITVSSPFKKLSFDVNDLDLVTPGKKMTLVLKVNGKKVFLAEPEMTGYDKLVDTLRKANKYVTEMRD